MLSSIVPTATPEVHDPKQIWQQACAHLKLKLTTGVYNTWIISNPLTQVEETADNLFLCTITSPTAFHSMNVKKSLSSQIKAALKTATGREIELRFEIGSPVFKPKNSGLVKKKTETISTDNTGFQSQNIPNNISSNDGGLFSSDVLSLSQEQQERFQAQKAGLKSDFSFETFAVSSTNEMAHAAAIAVSRQPGTAYNPLFLYGGVGVGKTHLMHAIGNNIISHSPQSRVIYVTSETFTNEIVSAIQTKKALHFKHKYRSANVLLVDDIQFIAGKNTVQEEFFHTFNSLINQNAQIIITSDRPPHEISLLEDRLRSRFEAGLMIDIQQPTFELRTAILLIKAKAYNVFIPMELAKYVAAKVESARKIEGVVKSLKSEIELKKAVLDKNLIEKLLSGENNSEEFIRLRVKPQEVIKTVSDHFHIKQITVRGKSRVKAIVKARHVAMYLMKIKLNMSYTEIGAYFSGRDHTTSMHAVAKIEAELRDNIQLQQDVTAIFTSLSALSR